MKTMTARYPGTCRGGCGKPIQAGEAIIFAGRGRVFHTACYHDLPRADAGSSYTRFASGAEVFTNRRGRCEDAPCCGCCS